MRAPDFWRHDGVLAYLLTPLGWAYDLAGRTSRALMSRTQAAVPVVCVGNLVAGGAGKTPAAIAVAERLIARGLKPHFLTRGYGGKETGPLRVDPLLHTPHEVGDEALLLARVAPTWVAGQRPSGAAAAVAGGAEVIVMDDGFQNPTLLKDLSLVVIDGNYGFGNARVMPAGPLRERISGGLSRADAVILIGEDDTDAIRRVRRTLPILNAEIVPASVQANKLKGRRVLAFAGIGRPEKFFATLEALGAKVVETRSFADHHPYEAVEVDWIIKRAHALDAVPVTTEKDAVRLPPERREDIEVLPVILVWDRPEAIDNLLEPAVAND
jgi:tetraacyldisaccharide 4'-kinase